MAKNVKRIANRLGANVVAKVPQTGGGAFGAARLSRVMETLRARLVPSAGQRVGRPSDAIWIFSPKVPMSVETRERLAQLAKSASTADRKVSPMQIAAQILEEALATAPTR
jgi:hypothetical protein